MKFLTVKADFCYFDLVIRQGKYQLEENKNYYILNKFVLIAKRLIEKHDIFFEVKEEKENNLALLF